MPRSHWSYELQFGSREWLPALLERLAINPRPLISQANGAAIEFAHSESILLGQVLEQLLRQLNGSDFALAFPGHQVMCTVHHHKQLWWITTDQLLATALETDGKPRSRAGRVRFSEAIQQVAGSDL